MTVHKFVERDNGIFWFIRYKKQSLKIVRHVNEIYESRMSETSESKTSISSLFEESIKSLLWMLVQCI